jgi:hypothetical protein
MRLDTTYYYWPATWVQNRPGMFTGSGMPMRFADTDGTILDVYQATTQMTDESGQSLEPGSATRFTVDALLNKAIGPEGYYGVFTANMHTDVAAHAGSDAIIASAQEARANATILGQTKGVPVVSGRQMLEWLDGRNGSSFNSLTWSNNTLSFTITIGVGANGLQAMLPVNVAAGTLANINRNGNTVIFTRRTIKGVEYAIFTAAAGTYQATYGP